MDKSIKTRSKSSLFLMELIIVLLFFSLCAAICMKVFATSKVKTDTARDLSQSSFAAETVAEVYKSFGGDVDKVADHFGYDADEGNISFYYDKQWNLLSATDKADSVYTMSLVSTEKGVLKEALISVTKNGDSDSIFEVAAATVGDATKEEDA